MPTYDYRCTENGQVVEVTHRMSERIQSWGDLCSKAGIEPGDTNSGSPVERLATGGQVVASTSLKNSDAPSCGAGGCGAGFCGMN